MNGAKNAKPIPPMPTTAAKKIFKFGTYFEHRAVRYTYKMF